MCKGYLTQEEELRFVAAKLNRNQQARDRISVQQLKELSQRFLVEHRQRVLVSDN